MRAASTARSTSRPTSIRELGVGINTLPHAIKELKELGLLRAARRGRDPHLRAVLPEPLRPGDLARAARHRRGLRRAAILDPPRQAAERDLPGGARAARREPLPLGRGLAPSRRTMAASPLFLRPHRLAPRDRARRRADRRRRHPFVRARQALPNEGPPRLERHDAVARRDRLAAIPHRPLDGDRGRASRRSSCSTRSAPAPRRTAGSPTGP